MNNDTIKILNLEEENIDPSKSYVDKANGNLMFTIKLKTKF